MRVKTIMSELRTSNIDKEVNTMIERLEGEGNVVKEIRQKINLDSMITTIIYIENKGE